MRDNKTIKVVCILPLENLILEKIYNATLISDWDYPLCYRLKNENGLTLSYNHKSFVTLKEYRKLKLEKLKKINDNINRKK